MNPTIHDVDRDPRATAREARRFRALLLDLLSAVDDGLRGGEEARHRLAETARRVERAGWPKGIAAKRSGR